MNPTVAAASVIAAALAVGLAAIGPVLVKVLLLEKLFPVSPVNPKLKERIRWYPSPQLGIHGILNHLRLGYRSRFTVR
jgi:hypothetical protein